MVDAILGVDWPALLSFTALKYLRSRRVPDDGGFYFAGIARESWWTKDGLGPEADPDLWFITDEGILHFFRR